MKNSKLRFSDDDKVYRACIDNHEIEQGDHIVSPEILEEPVRTKEDWWRYVCARAVLGDVAELVDFFDPDVNTMPIVCDENTMPETVRSTIAGILKNAMKRGRAGRPRMTELERRAENPIHDAYDFYRSTTAFLGLHFPQTRKVDRRDRALVYAARYVNENEDEYPDKILAFDRLHATDRSLLPSEQDRRKALREFAGK